MTGGDIDHDADGSPITARRWGRTWVRLLVVLVVAVGVCFPVWFVVSWRWFAGARRGWVPAVASFGVLGLLAGWLGAGGRDRAVRRYVAAGLALAGGAVGGAVAHWAPPTPGRLREAIAAVEQPGWDLVGESVDGDPMCFDYCTSVSRSYRFDQEPSKVAEQLGPVLRRAGLLAGPSFPPHDYTFFPADDGRDVDLAATVGRSEGGGTTVAVTARAG